MSFVDYSQKPLLRVEHLEQFFKLGKNTLKAVNDVSFDIYKGEVFGLVGESGCGKTTTGRSIIKLYNITGGSVYYNDTRICAGVNSYKENIIRAKAQYDKTILVIKNDNKLNEAEKAKRYVEAAKLRDDTIEKNMAEIKKAKYDHKHCSEEFTAKQIDNVKEKFAPLLAQKPVYDVFSETEEQQVKDYRAELAKVIKATKKESKEIQKKEIEFIKNRYAGVVAKLERNEKLEKEEKELLAAYKRELKIAKRDNIMNKIQMIFQDPIASLDPRMTVHDIIAEGLIIRGITDKNYINEQVYRVLDLVGLVAEHASRYPHEFSGGQRQRIGIARAILLNPEIIIADEPISALDVSIQAQVINLLNDLREKMGLTILFIAHDLSVVKYFSDRIAVMYFGNLVELASSDELFDHPLHPYTKSLLSAIPLPDPHYEKNRKRITYNPLAAHDYSKQAPTLREVSPKHYVLCNDEEEARYLEEIKELDARKSK